MSGSYASRLSEYSNKGVCGLPERMDTERSFKLKMETLLDMVQKAKRIVVLTGAGISTSAGIPDFRGPTGIWTQEKQLAKAKATNAKRKNKARPAAAATAAAAAGSMTSTSTPTADDDTTSKKRKRTPTVVDFDQAAPTLTHRALVFLTDQDKIHFVVTQNVDGLHKRSGLSRDHHAVLHGCVFTEVCEDCHTEHFRDFDVGGMSFQPTGRTCDVCSTGTLRDCLLDWEDALPEFDFERAQDQCEMADLVLALGTSLRIEPAGSLPTLAKQFVIVNLQATPYDAKANLIVRAPVDSVMTKLIEGLGYTSDWDSNMNVTIERHWKQPT